MLTDIFPFSFNLDPVTISGISLWSLALYLGFSPVSEWFILQLSRWFNFAERSLYMSQSEYEKTRKARESQNAFYAAIFSIVPFLLIGGLCNWLVEFAFDRSWSISVGIIACIGCGVYELGRKDGQNGE